MEITLSASRIKLFQSCPKLYSLYVSGNYEKKETPEMRYGKEVHELVRQAITTGGVTNEKALKIADRIKALNKRIVGFETEVNYQEKLFKGSEEVLITWIGYLDVLLENGIVEIKTHNEITNEDVLQCEVYAYALNYPVYLITPEETYVVTDWGNVPAIVDEIIKAHIKNEFPTKTGSHCQYCPLAQNGTCEQFKEVQLTIKEEKLPTTVEKLVELYEKTQLLTKAIETKLKEIAKEKPVQLSDGRMVALVKSPFYKLKKEISIEDVMNIYGMEYLKIDTQKLKQVAPHLFNEYFRNELRIITPENQNKEEEEV